MDWSNSPENYDMYSHINIIAVILLTPLIKLLIKDNETSRAVQFYYVVAMIIVSPFLRFYREGWTEFNRSSKL